MSKSNVKIYSQSFDCVSLVLSIHGSLEFVLIGVSPDVGGQGAGEGAPNLKGGRSCHTMSVVKLRSRYFVPNKDRSARVCVLPSDISKDFFLF